MTDSCCVCLIASNDHEPLIAHPGSYDADRCIHRNDHGQPRGRTTPAGKQAAVLAVVVTIAKGYDLGYIWKTQDHTTERTGGYYLNAAQAGEPGAQSEVGGYYEEGKGIKELVKEMERETNVIFEGIIDDGIAAGAFRRCRVDVVTYDIVMLGHMWALKRWYLGKAISLDAYIDEQTTFILDGLRAPEAR